MAQPTSPITINQLLAFSPDSISSLQFDLLQGPAAYDGLDQSLVPRLLEPATDPPLPHMVIISPLKWPIQVRSGQWARLSRIFPPSRVLAQEYVAVLDVLNALCNSLHDLVPGKFASPFYDNSESVDFSFRTRIDMEEDSAKRENEKRKGLKKLDYLCGRTRFLGLSPTLQEHGRVVKAHFSYGKLRPGIHCVLNKQVSDAPRYTSSARSPCYKGTRESILGSINEWLSNSHTPQRVCWLYGPAGSGKSAIAQSIAKNCDEASKLAATFFFFRADSNRNTANLLFPTLASQLAAYIPEMSARIDEALLADPQLLSKPIDVQFKDLIKRPFEGIDKQVSAESFSKLIVIDGVDECLEETAQQRFLNDIGNAVASDIPLRFLLCSRPEPHISEVFSNSTFSNQIFHVPLEENAESLHDIGVYLTDSFTRISRERGICPDSWPSKEDMDHLVKSSSGHFIYAATVIKFVDDNSDNSCDPKEKLNIVLGLQSSNTSPFGALDQLYIEILNRQKNQVLLGDFLRIFVVFVAGDILQQGADTNTLFRVLMGFDVQQLSTKLPGMHSLLKFSLPIIVHHKSFLDFLLSQTRSGQYYVDKRQASRDFLEEIVEVFKRCAEVEHPNRHNDSFVNLFRISKCLTFISPRHLTDDWWEILYTLYRFREDNLAPPQLDIVRPSIDNFLSHTSSYPGPVSIQDHAFQVLQRVRYFFGI